MTHRIPLEEITQLMQFVAEKSKNVKSPLNISELCRQFNEETGCSMPVNTFSSRIYTNRLKIHRMDDFDMETKVKMMFALCAPIDAGFLSELTKIADVEVDDQQRITKYKQKDGGLELRAKHLQLSMNVGEQRSKSIIQFLAEKSKTVNTPIADQSFLREFKANSGCSDSIVSLTSRYKRVKNTIFELPEIDKNTKVKMMFLSHAQLSDNILAKLQRNATVKLDEHYRIKKYKAYDGSLELGMAHERAVPKRSRLSHSPSELSKENDDIENPVAEGGLSTSLSLSLLEFLNHLRRPAIKLNIPFVANKIDREIEILEKKDEQIPINNIIESLEEFIQILETPDEMDSDNETICLSDYLYHLGLSMCYIAHPLMNEFQKKLRNLVAAEDQQIPLEHIRHAIEKTLDKITC